MMWLTRASAWVKVIFALCLIGLATDTVHVWRDATSDGVLLRLHAGFLLLYIGQIGFILVRERWVWMLTLLQGGMALLTNADFIFSPVLRILVKLVYLVVPDLTLGGEEAAKYIFISLAFTLQLLSAWMLWVHLAKNPPDLAETATGVSIRNKGS